MTMTFCICTIQRVTQIYHHMPVAVDFCDVIWLNIFLLFIAIQSRNECNDSQCFQLINAIVDVNFEINLNSFWKHAAHR